MADAVERVLTLRFQPDMSAVDSALAGLEQRASRPVSFGTGGGGAPTFSAEGPAIGGGAPPAGGLPGVTPGSGGFRPARNTDDERLWAIRERTSLIGMDPGQRLGYWQQRSGEMQSGTLGRARADDQVARAEQALAKAKEREAAAAEKNAAREEARMARQFDAIVRTASRYDAGGTVSAAEAAAEDAKDAEAEAAKASRSARGRTGRIAGLRLGRLGYMTTIGFAGMEAFRLANAETQYGADLGEAGNDPMAQYRAAMKAQQAAYRVPFLGQAAEFVSSPFRQQTESTMAEAERQNKQTAEGMQDVQRQIQQRRAIEMESTPGAFGQAMKGAQFRFEDQRREINERSGQRLGNVSATMGIRGTQGEHQQGWQSFLNVFGRQLFSDEQYQGTSPRQLFDYVMGVDPRAADQAGTTGADSSHLNAVIAAKTAAEQARNQQERDLAEKNARRTIAAQTGTYDLEANIGQQRAAGGRGRDFELRAMRQRHGKQEQDVINALGANPTQLEMQNVNALTQANLAQEAAQETENRRTGYLSAYSSQTRAGVAGLQTRRMSFEASVYGQYRRGQQEVAQADPADRPGVQAAANAELGRTIADNLRGLANQNRADFNAGTLSQFALNRDPRGAALARLRQERDEELEQAGGGLHGFFRRPFIEARYRAGVAQANQQYQDQVGAERFGIQAQIDVNGVRAFGPGDFASRQTQAQALQLTRGAEGRALAEAQKDANSGLAQLQLKLGVSQLQAGARDYLNTRFTGTEANALRIAPESQGGGTNPADAAGAFTKGIGELKQLMTKNNTDLITAIQNIGGTK